MADALHPQTFLAYGMNGDELPVGNGGPLRLRLPRQLGYKSVKFITHLTVTDSLKGFGKGLGSASPEARLCLVRRHLTGEFPRVASLSRILSPRATPRTSESEKSDLRGIKIRTGTRHRRPDAVNRPAGSSP